MGGRKEPARCDLRHGVSEGQRNAHAPGRAVERQLHLGRTTGGLHFGLGDATDAGTAEIHWPSGAKETVKLPAVDRIYTITEGKGITGAMCGGKPCADRDGAGRVTAKPAAK